MRRERPGSRTRDLTVGPVAPQLALFALPLLGSSLIQQLYNTVDLLFVGNVLGKEASAAVGASSLLVTCLLGFFIGLSAGVGIVIAHAFGKGEPARLQAAASASILCGIVGGAGITVLGWIFAPTLLAWLNTPESVLSEAVAYLRVYLLGTTSVLTYNMGAAVLRAVGDSRSPLAYQFAGGACNVALDALFLLVLDRGIESAAWAGCIAQTVAATLVVASLVRSRDDRERRLVSPFAKGGALSSILRVGAPIGLQTTAITLSNILVQHQINGLGVDAVAAFAAYFKIELLIYLPIMAFGQAMTVFAAQCIGAGKEERMRAGVRSCLAMSAALAAATSWALLGLGSLAFGAFNPDTSVIAQGTSIIAVTFPFYVIYPVLEILGSAVRGAGRPTIPMAIVLGNICVLRTVAVLAVASTSYDAQSIALVYPLSWATTGICMAAYYLRGTWLPSCAVPQARHGATD